MARNVIVGQSGGPTAVINASLAWCLQGSLLHGRRHGLRDEVRHQDC